MMSLTFCLDAVVLVCSNLYTNYFLPSKFVHEFLKFAYKFFLSFSGIRMYVNSCTNLYANSQVNFVHKIRAKFVIFDKPLGKVHANSHEFMKVMLGMACTVESSAYRCRDNYCFVLYSWTVLFYFISIKIYRI